MVELLRVIADSTGCSRLNGRVSHDPTKGRKGIPSYTTAKVEDILCDTALTCAFSAETPFISSEVLREAIVELKWLPYTERRSAPAGKAALQA